ncbi:hypothetical protein HDEF_0468 [Candidatus Hamiltonella defensa 5AT (Acyrthosiphon pisum)]|uniref:Uncharacterized protein n=1 Tax=Hamiltonella defensa subsp. Acyrthosiphon pisum (strain 5AT) TaxID=572265 RepID=C4K3S9_HAMD5|nr:hypothetical protein HDEF_0468 [Candidatus Hamiltonella defensa 5AT (Acyrthosiphon pisum)]
MTRLMSGFNKSNNHPLKQVMHQRSHQLISRMLAALEN